MSASPEQPEPNAMRRLAITLAHDGLDPGKMSSAELDAYLKAHRVNLVSAEKEFSQILKKVGGQLRLEEARQKRLGMSQNVQSICQKGQEALRAQIKEWIEVLTRKNHSEALVYAREFEKATPEDLESLAQDMALLDILNEGKKDGSPTDRGN